MKSTVKFLGIVALVAVIGFSFVTCSNSAGGGSAPTAGSVRSVEFKNDLTDLSSPVISRGYNEDGSWNFSSTSAGAGTSFYTIYMVFPNTITSAPTGGSNIGFDEAMEVWIYTNGEDFSAISGLDLNTQSTYSFLPKLAHTPGGSANLNSTQFRKFR